MKSRIEVVLNAKDSMSGVVDKISQKLSDVAENVRSSFSNITSSTDNATKGTEQLEKAQLSLEKATSRAAAATQQLADAEAALAAGIDVSLIERENNQIERRNQARQQLANATQELRAEEANLALTNQQLASVGAQQITTTAGIENARKKVATSTARLSIEEQKLDGVRGKMDSRLVKLEGDVEKARMKAKVAAQQAAVAEERLNQVRKSASASGEGLFGKIAGSSMVAPVMGLFAGFMTLKAGISAAWTALISYNAELDNTKMAFETMFGGNREAAEDFVKDLQDFAAKTTFKFPELAQGTQKLIAMGFAAEDTFMMMTRLGDASAGLKLGQAGIDRLSLALGQMKTKGKVAGEEMRQLVEAGIPAWEFLAEKSGKTIEEMREEVSKGAVSAEDAIQTILDGMDGKFGGLMEKQAKGWSGIFSNLSDDLSQIFGSLGEGLFKNLESKLAKVADFVKDFNSTLKSDGLASALEDIIPPQIMDKIYNLMGAFGDLFDTLGEGFDTLMANPWTEIIGDAMMWLVGFAIDRITNLVDAVSFISKVFFSVRDAVGHALAGMAGFVEKHFGWLINKIKWLVNTISQTVPSWIKKHVFGIDEETRSSGVRDSVSKIGKQAASQKRYEGLTGKKLGEGDPTTSPSKGGGGGANKAEKAIYDINNKIRDLIEKMDDKIFDELAPAYENSFRKLNSEVEKWMTDLQEQMKANNVTVDLSELESKAREYKETLIEPITRAWKNAWTDIKFDTEKVWAEMLGNKKRVSEIEFEIALESIEREKRERFKAIAQSKDDAEAKVAVERWADARIAKLQKEKRERDQEAYLSEIETQIALNETLYDLEGKSIREIAKLNRILLEDKIRYLDEELRQEGLTNAEILRIRQQRIEAQKALETVGGTSASFKAGLNEQVKEWGDWGKQVQDVGRETASAMNSMFSDMFFDAMTGQIKSLSDYFSNFLKSLAKSISQALSNAMTSKLLGSLFGGLPGRATGGPVNNQPYIVGENGPEIFVPQSHGRIVNNDSLRNMSGATGGSGDIQVNIINQSGQEVGVAKTETKFDGAKTIITLVMEALSKNTNGSRDILRGMMAT